jgi:hypothetical protein
MKKFWKGKKRHGKKLMRHGRGLGRNFYFNWFFKHGLPKIGDITHDCDGENHVISFIEPYQLPLEGSWRSEIQVRYKRLEDDQEANVCSCGGHGFQPPYPADWPLKYLMSKNTPEGREFLRKWNWTATEDLMDRALAGEKIFDERGVRIAKKR